ncbi:MAG: hypothetical protein S4CHLAM45_02770 [Chlamydiales bacterium]|nr:hypothetical protein [Chlamydiales bacterium]MCH9619135.1 hypothetical protein [Chlamydiales bacterium]MCH9622397.1 hypothetical protein [Chlamydiales bacterium]
MSEIFYRIFIKNWHRKLIALIAAIVVWFLVNKTISITRTIPNVPVRVINVPPDKTIINLLPNGMMKHRVSVTVTGLKSIVNDLRPNDLEVIVNAEEKKESWIVTIDKKDLINHVANKDWSKDISSVTSNDLYIKMSKLITEEIPLTINKPIGDPPKGYQFLDIWPKYLTQKVSGPQEQVQTLKERGMEVTFNLNRITKPELDALQSTSQTDEISFFIPDTWKMVSLPFKGNSPEMFNDPRAKLLRIDFLKQEFLPLGVELPITIFFPIKYSKTINPGTYSLQTNEFVEKKDGLKLLTTPLYVRDVSRLFLEVVRDNLLLAVIAVPDSVQKNLDWAVEFIDEKVLEDIFVKASLKELESIHQEKNSTFSQSSEQASRYRFRDYLRHLQLYTEDGQPLKINAKLGTNLIEIERE